MATDPKLIVSLEARLDRFEKQMKDAGLIAGKRVQEIEDTFAKANPQFAPTFLGNFFGNLASSGLRQGLSIIGDLVERFKDLERVSRLTSVSMNDLFGLQEAASKFGAPVDAVTQSVKALAVLLDQMQRGEQNSLTKLFDANPEALRGVNREALTLQQTFQIVADLVQNARTEVQKIDLARAAGQAESMVPFLEKGGAAVRGLQQAASDAAPDLQKIANLAKDFDDAWSAAIKNLKAYIVGEFAGSLKQTLLDAIDLGLKFLGLFKGGVLSGVADEAAGKWKAVRDQIEAFGKGATEPAAREAARRGNLAGGGTSTADLSRALSNAPSSGATARGGGGSGRDSFEREEDRINKRIAVLMAETATMGQGVKAREEAKAAAELWNAAERAGIPVTDELRDKIGALAAKWGEASAAALAAKDRFAEIQGAAKEFSGAVSEAFKGLTLEGKNFDEVLQNLVKRLASSAIDRLFDTLIFGGRSATSGGALGGLFGAIFGGARAEGGPVMPGRSYLVGEHGPEILTPRSAGMVIPNSVMRGAGSGVTIAPSMSISIVGSDIKRAEVEAIVGRAVGKMGSDLNRNFPARLDRYRKLGT